MTTKFFLFFLIASLTVIPVYGNEWQTIDGWQTVVAPAHKMTDFEDEVLRIEISINYENKEIVIEKGFNTFRLLNGDKVWTFIENAVEKGDGETSFNVPVKPLVEFVWTVGDKVGDPYVKVPITYLPDGTYPCDNKDFQACHTYDNEGHHMYFYASHNIFEKKRGIANPDIIGMSEFEHEVLHAWGVSHSEMERWFNPEIPVDCGLFKCPTFPKVGNHGQYIR